ncbi:MAG: threonylcarbamoyl-AMP synthase [Saprospiraceae bacterium]|nr:threonylcarbamoyl-AMP synthase [Saprospiraceae bacterium]
MERIQFHADNPNKRDLKKLAEEINKGAIFIFPTDTMYALGCLMNQRAGIEKICKILNKKEKQTKMSLICPNISAVSKYTQQIDNQVFKAMKRYLPGPYTFILKSNNYVQKYFKNNREEIGIRIPDNILILELLEILEVPVISTSLNTDGEFQHSFNDPEDIFAVFENKVDILIDTGTIIGGESTVIDCTNEEMEIVRQGIGPIE